MMKSPVLQILPLRSIFLYCRRNALSRLPRRAFHVTASNNISEENSIGTLSKLASTATQNSSSSPASSSPFTSINNLVSGIGTYNPSGPSAGSFAASMTSLEAARNFRVRPPHHLHVYSTRHNCHITLSDGNRQPIISVSSGNIGFRKAARGTYDAGFQLGAYVMRVIVQQRIVNSIQHLEIVLRDFGPGREAFTKILLGSEGLVIRDKVVRVMDATRLKFGGTRSKKPRRLG